MTNESFTKLSNDFLQLAFTESEKALAESLTSYREIINKSYIAIAFYMSALIYFFEHSKKGFDMYDLLMIISAASTLYISQNLFSAKMHSPGTEPTYTINEFYAIKPKEDQARAFLVTKLKHMAKAINFNYTEVGIRNKRFRWSAVALIIACILSSLFGLFWK